jgi:hypothetical protein
VSIGVHSWLNFGWTARGSGPKKLKKSLAMATGIAKNGMTLGEAMPKLRTRSAGSLTFRLLFIVASALLLLAAFAPRANANCPGCIRYYNFEGAPTAPYPVNLDSHVPAIEVGPTFGMVLQTGTDPTMAATGAYPSGDTVVAAGIPLNVAIGDPDPNLVSLGINRSGRAQLYMDIPMFSAVGIYNVTSITFAIGGNGNGYAFASVLVSFNGGTSFTQIGATQAIPSGPGTVLTFTLPNNTTINQPTLIVRLAFTGGQSNGTDLQNEFDNVQINGTVVPEPATVAGGLLGVLGLCWFQRRRLRSLLPRSSA